MKTRTNKFDFGVAFLATCLGVISCTTSTRLFTNASPDNDPLDPSKPNIVFLVVESTDGRTWRRGYQNGVLPLPNLRRLEDQGATSFYRHYCNSPVCCPSRASFWSGKHPHKIPHQHDDGYVVNGAWNNFEGLPEDYSETIFHVLQEQGYSTKLSGKLDHTVGNHSLSDRVSAWTMYVDFPFNLTNYEPWATETGTCRFQGSVEPVNSDTNPQEFFTKDWRALNETIDWIKDHVKRKDSAEPFFVYQGMNIVHPPYYTNEFWLSKIDDTKIDVPDWPREEHLNHLHPCDVQMSMLKGCFAMSSEEDQRRESIDRRRRIRQIYYATIAEFDAMVGRYMDTINDLGLANNTVFVVTSDHGDMQMEHGQYYKMSAYDASSSVPLIIYDPRKRKPKNQVIDGHVTQHLDLFPTILELAGAKRATSGLNLDGHSLVPFLQNPLDQGERGATSSRGLETNMGSQDDRPPFAVFQYHGSDSPMSWFAIVQPLPCMDHDPSERTPCMYKLVVWGTGIEENPQLFDLTHDPDENENLIHDPDYELVAGTLNSNLEATVDYSEVAKDVAKYNRESFVRWKDQLEGDWKEAVADASLRWHKSWMFHPEEHLAAIERWMSLEDDSSIRSCRVRQDSRSYTMS